MFSPTNKNWNSRVFLLSFQQACGSCSCIFELYVNMFRIVFLVVFLIHEQIQDPNTPHGELYLPLCKDFPSHDSISVQYEESECFWTRGNTKL